MENKNGLLKLAVRLTIPVMTGYLFLGFAFGILMSGKGFSPGWPALMSAIIFAGSMQFVAADLLAGAFAPLYAFLLTLVVNARHLFYGISMLGQFRGTGNYKPYLIFGLTDETFSLLCSTPMPEDSAEKNRLMFFVTLLDQAYWLTGTILGALAGSLLSFDFSGIEFVMTALFLVIVLNQWQNQPKHEPAVIGVGVTAICLAIFGPKSFIIPSMIVMVVLLCAFRGPIERGLP